MLVNSGNALCCAAYYTGGAIAITQGAAVLLLLWLVFSAFELLAGPDKRRI